jgi:hypothetical protein
MKMELTKDEKKALLSSIRSVLETGKPWEDKALHHPAGASIGAALSIPGMKKCETDEEDRCRDGFDTNGWQWDWWQMFTFKGKDYTLSGSGYYGGHAFHLADE